MEGCSISAVGRLLNRSWNTAARWLDRARRSAAEFNDRHIRGYELVELQADELKAVTPRTKRDTWVFTAMEVWSRLWAETVVGRRSAVNTRRLMNETATKSVFTKPPLITTDGLEHYGPAVKGIFRGYCIYGQVIKKRCKNRITRVDRRLVVGSADALENALQRSEDSTTLNTSFIERLNLTIRAGSAYLRRRSSTHHRSPTKLEGQLDLARCHYNFHGGASAQPIVEHRSALAGPGQTFRGRVQRSPHSRLRTRRATGG